MFQTKQKEDVNKELSKVLEIELKLSKLETMYSSLPIQELSFWSRKNYPLFFQKMLLLLYISRKMWTFLDSILKTERESVGLRLTVKPYISFQKLRHQF